MHLVVLYREKDGVARGGLDVSGRPRGRASGIDFPEAESDASGEPQGRAKGIKRSEDAGGEATI